jgi:uracil-DNA glycosylase
VTTSSELFEAAGLHRPLRSLIDELPADWRPLVERWAASAAGTALINWVDARVRAGAKVFPAEVFKALHVTPMAAVRVVILGQDPYHGEGQAEGLAFSVPAGVRVPPSLRNVFKEQARDLALPVPTHGHLGHWARQGVLLLNTALTVESGQAGSHSKLGWEALTDDIIQMVSSLERPVVFMLWGAHAHAKAPFIRCRERHLVLQSNHPSPLSALRPPAPFVGCGHFSVANQFVLRQAPGEGPIAWR